MQSSCLKPALVLSFCMSVSFSDDLNSFFLFPTTTPNCIQQKAKLTRSNERDLDEDLCHLLLIERHIGIRKRKMLIGKICAIFVTPTQLSTRQTFLSLSIESLSVSFSIKTKQTEQQSIEEEESEFAFIISFTFSLTTFRKSR